jgi:hypothetical protein
VGHPDVLGSPLGNFREHKPFCANATAANLEMTAIDPRVRRGGNSHRHGGVMAMKLRVWFGVCVVATMWSSAYGQSCTSYPYNSANGLQNGSPADPGKLLTNFTYLSGCLAPLASPSFTGNVGIGTANPTAMLSIYGGGLDLGANTYTQDLSLSTDGSGNGYIMANSVGGGYRNLFLGNGSTTRMTIASANGYVGIWTTTPSSTLYVNGTSGGTNSWINSSDKRLKKDIRPIENALAMIGKIQGVRFNWRTPAERSVGKALNLPTAKPQIGFIAQDLEKVVPEAVAVADGPEKIRSVAESKVVPVLVEAVKELKAANDRLQSAKEHQAAENEILMRNDRAMRTDMVNLERRLAALETKTAAGASGRSGHSRVASTVPARGLHF